jgi:hypothetical protein
MGAAVFPENFPINDAVFLDPAAEHCLEKIQLAEVCDPLADEVDHFKKHKKTDGECHPGKLCELILQHFMLDEDSENDVPQKNSDDLRDGTNDVKYKSNAEVPRPAAALEKVQADADDPPHPQGEKYDEHARNQRIGKCRLYQLEGGLIEEERIPPGETRKADQPDTKPHQMFLPEQ